MYSHAGVAKFDYLCPFSKFTKSAISLHPTVQTCSLFCKVSLETFLYRYIYFYSFHPIIISGLDACMGPIEDVSIKKYHDVRT